MIENIVDALDEWFAARMDDVHTCIPAKFDTYYGHKERKARVKPLTKILTSKGASISIPLIDNVPVMFPSGSEFSLTWKPKKGDGCLLLISEMALGNYLNSPNETEIESSNRFNLTDAICLPGLWSFPSVPAAPANEDDMFLTYKDTYMQMDGKTTTINGNLEVDV